MTDAIIDIHLPSASSGSQAGWIQPVIQKTERRYSVNPSFTLDRRTGERKRYNLVKYWIHYNARY